MARIPIYNFQAQVTGQAGSTDVVQIPQSATSGAIASVADTTAKALTDIAKFGNVIIENESKRIVAQEQINYKTQLDTAQKNIQLQFPNQPEIWMDEYEKVKTSLLGEIQSKDYKYDFIKRSVTNNVNLDFLPLRNGLFNNFITKTKTLNLITFEQSSMTKSNSVGEAVLLNEEDFRAEQFSLTESLANFATYGGADQSLKLQTDAYKNAFRIGLERVFANNTPSHNSQLTLENIEKLDDGDIPGMSNLKEIIKMLDDTDARAVLEKFSDNEFETFKLQDRLNSEIMEDQKAMKDELLYTLFTTNDQAERSGAYDKLQKLPYSVFDDGERNEYRNWYDSSITSEGFKPFVNPMGNEALTAQLKSHINEFKVTFSQLQQFMPELSKAQQDEIMSEWHGKRKELKGDFRNKVRSAFGLGVGDGIIIIGEKESETKAIISGVTSLAIDLFNDLVTTNPNANFAVEVPKIIKEAKLQDKDGIRNTVEGFLNTNAQFKSLLPEDTTPENFTSNFQKTYSDLIAEGTDESQAKAFELQVQYNQYKDIIQLYDSYN